MTKAKTKTPQRSSKQSKQKLVQMMREMEKSAVVLTSTKSPTPGSCARIYCI